MRTLYRTGLATYPDMLDLPLLRRLPERFLTWLTVKGMALFDMMTRPYDRVAREYGLPLFKNMERLWEGDYNQR
ncbi:MAG TPA: hypothetical protein EYP04_11630 [Anaerolineae bacterium]|nr:hypothetical protein [Anaerolineae bacterium]HIQ04596.1 hypothetical protein [Anaerolineae bacterium]